MAAISLTTTARVNVVESFVQVTLPAAEAITAGQAVRLDTSNGKFTKANATTAAEARFFGIALKSAAAGEPLTVLRSGIIDGFTLTSQAYDAAVYLNDTDGVIGDAAGTVSTVIGRVIPAHAQTLGTALDKLLLVEPF